MTTRSETPELTRREEDLGWIAATPSDHPWRIAVIGCDEQEATERYYEALARWTSLPSETGTVGS